jgi:hypothetical protein
MLVPLIAGALLGQTQKSPSLVDWLDRQVTRRVRVTGYRRIGYHLHDVDGDDEAFNTLNYGGLGDRRFTDFGQVRLEGRKVFGLLDFEAQILDSRFEDPQQQRITLDFERDGLRAQAGDIQGALLNTNRFAGFTRSLRGVQIGYRRGRFDSRALRSESKGEARTVVIAGNNSAGPYYLQSSQVVPDTERVRIDDVELRLGRDYVINYELGSITFIDRIVPPTSEIVVTYETFAFNAARGVIQGAGISYDMGRAGRFGLTYLNQRPRGGSALSQRLERFQGFGPPGTPYVLQFEPLRGRPIVVRLDGVIQAEGVDYFFDAENASVFYTTRFVPPSSTIDVLYTPRPLSTLDGEREVIGLDYRLSLGGRGTLTLSQANGRLLSATNPLSGTARGADISYSSHGWQLSASAKDVPPGYVTVESRGLNRNERSIDWRLGRQDGRLRYGVNQSNSSITTRSTGADGAVVFRPSRFTSTRGFATWEPREGDDWRISAEHQRTRSRNEKDSSGISTTGVEASRTFGRGDVRFGLRRQDGSGLFRNGAITERRAISLDSVRMGGSYRPDDRLSLTLQSSISTVRSDGRRGAGRDVSVSAAYVPSDAWRIQAGYELGDSGSLTSLGSFQSGFGAGFDGSGFNSGLPGGTPIGATDYRRWQASAQWTVGDGLSVDTRFNQIRYAGSVSSNSETTSYGLGVSADLGSSAQLSAAIDRSSTRFIGSALTSQATTVSAALGGDFGRRWRYRLGASLLFTGGTSSFAQDAWTYEGSLDYRLAARQNLSLFALSGRTRGYLPQDSSDLSLTYQYQLIDALALNVRYRIQNVSNRSADFTSGAYRSRGLDVELAFNFGR